MVLRTKMKPHHPRCIACPIMLPGPGRGCQTVTTIYEITCSAVGCEDSYIGMTMDLLNTRIRSHLSTLRHPQGISRLYEHFRVPGHEMRFSVIEPLGVCTRQDALQAERRYIKNLCPSLNRIVNKARSVRVTSTPGKPGTHPCGRCATCPAIKIGLGGAPLCAAPGANCTSSHVVYCLSCRQCPDRFYCGSTSMNLSQRLKDHRSMIKNNYAYSTRLCHHFRQPGHEMTVAVLEQCTPETLRRSEAVWISRLDCKGPRGLNDRSPIVDA